MNNDLWKQIQEKSERELEQILSSLPMEPYEMFQQANQNQLVYYQNVVNNGGSLEEQLNLQRMLNHKKKNQNQAIIPQTEILKEIQQEKSEKKNDEEIQYTNEDSLEINEELAKIVVQEATEDKEAIYQITYDNGDVYKGELNGYLKEGSGTYFYANGEKYDGLFQDDMIHGYGKYFFQGGEKYEGDWYQGEKCGIGILQFKNGLKYVGEFENDLFDGKGKLYYENGDLFEGLWKNGKKNGFGKFYGKDGRRIYGEWIDDELLHF